VYWSGLEAAEYSFYLGILFGLGLGLPDAVCRFDFDVGLISSYPWGLDIF